MVSMKSRWHGRIRLSWGQIVGVELRKGFDVSSDKWGGGEAHGFGMSTWQSAEVKVKGSPSNIAAVVGPLVASAIKASFLLSVGISGCEGGGFRSGRIRATCCNGFAAGITLGNGNWMPELDGKFSVLGGFTKRLRGFLILFSIGAGREAGDDLVSLGLHLPWPQNPRLLQLRLFDRLP